MCSLTLTWALLIDFSLIYISQPKARAIYKGFCIVLTQNDRQMNLGSILQVAGSRTMLSIYTNSQENSVKCEKQFAPFPGHLSGATFHLLHAHSNQWQVTSQFKMEWKCVTQTGGGRCLQHPTSSTPFCNQCQSHCLTNPLSSSY